MPPPTTLPAGSTSATAPKPKLVRIIWGGNAAAAPAASWCGDGVVGVVPLGVRQHEVLDQRHLVAEARADPVGLAADALALEPVEAARGHRLQHEVRGEHGQDERGADPRVLVTDDPDRERSCGRGVRTPGSRPRRPVERARRPLRRICGCGKTPRAGRAPGRSLEDAAAIVPGRAARSSRAGERRSIFAVVCALGAVWSAAYLAATRLMSPRGTSGRILGDIVYPLAEATAVAMLIWAAQAATGATRQFLWRWPSPRRSGLCGDVTWAVLVLVDASSRSPRSATPSLWPASQRFPARYAGSLAAAVARPARLLDGRAAARRTSRCRWCCDRSSPAISPRPSS